MRQIDEVERVRANSQAMPTIHLVAIARAAAGAKGEFDSKKLLPYPPIDDNRMRVKTGRVIVELMDEDLLPVHVLASMGRYLDQLPED